MFFAPLASRASALPEYPFVYVYGSAKREIAPDAATLSFQVKSYDAKAERANRQQSELADTFLRFAEKLGIPSENIVAQAIEKNAVQREDENGKEFEIVGYLLTRAVTVQLKDLAKFPQLVEFLYDQSYVEKISVKFSCKDETAILQNLTDGACQAAQENAERLAKGFQKKLAGVHAISEEGFAGMERPFGFQFQQTYGGFAAGASDKRDFRVIPATISFSKNVFAIFAIE